MPIPLTYPGVYIEEIPSGVRTITGVATSITAFVGRTLRGPVNEPITINSYGDFERIFGGLWIESTLGYAVRDFYLNGGSQAIIVRLVNPNFATDAERDLAIAAATAVADAAKGAADVAAAKTAAQTKASEFDSKTSAEKNAATAVANVINAVADNATLDVLKQAADDAASQSAVRKALLVVGGANKLTLAAISEGSWGNNLRARVDYDVPKDNELPQSYKAYGLKATDLFNLTVRDMQTGATEVFRNVTVKPSPAQVDKVIENDSRLVRVMGALPSALPKATDDGLSAADLKIIPFSQEDLEKNKRSTGVGTDSLGTNGNPLDRNAVTTGSGLEDGKKGLYALKKADLFNLLCIPPHIPGEEIEPGLVADAVTFCEQHRAFLIVDPPKAWVDKDTAKAGIGNFITSSNHAAVFFPRLKQTNPLQNNRIEEFAPCGAIAGIFARTDAQRGVWKAPAGLEAKLVGVPELSVSLNDAENGELNPLGVNCLRTFPAAGRVVWGARTLEGNDRLTSEWKYIPVRRLALFIEESLYRGTQWVVFEPNDEPLWAQIRLNVGAFMQNLFRQGAFQGKTPQEAYFVKCDKETTPQNDINLGIVNVVVGFAPLKPAEFVVIKLQQMAGQIAV